MRPLDARLVRYARSSALFLVAATLIGLLRTACTIAFCWLLAHAIASTVAGESLARQGATLSAIVIVIVIRAISVWAMDAASAAGSARVKSELRARVVSTITSLGPAWLGRRNRAEVATTTVLGLEALDGYFSLFLPQLVLTIVSTPVIVFMMYRDDVLSGIIVTVTLPLIPIFMVLIGWATQAAQQKQWSTLTHLSSRFLDAVNGLATLKIFGRERRQEARLAAITENYRHSTMKVLRMSFLSGFALELVATLSVALVAVSIGLRLVNGSLGLEVGLFVLLLAPEAFLPLRLVGANYHAAADGVAAATDVFAILDDGATAAPAAVAAASAPLEGTLRFDDLTIELGERTIIHGLTAVAKPGEVTVFAGPSGSGKSTVFAALLGFAEHSGSLTLGGLPVSRAQLAWSGQRSGLVAGTVSDNVALGSEHPDSLIVLRALALAAAGDIDPDRTVNAGADGLSGGQAERVSIARAIYRCLTNDCQVLVLDEPSAALDAETEARLMRGLRQLAGVGKTVVVASHRHAVISAADTIVSLTTTHRELSDAR